MDKIFIIAEAGVNHNGSLTLAKKLVKAAAQAGADAVKFQSFRAADLVTEQTPQAKYQSRNLGVKSSQYEMLRKLELTEAMHEVLERYARKQRILFMSTAFDEDSLEFLTSRFKLPFLKVPSGEITNAPFLLKIARKGLPVIVSTGMSSLDELRQALGVLAFGFTASRNVKPSPKNFRLALRSQRGKDNLKKNLILLHCVSDYPAPPEQINLRVLPALQREFGVRVGYSDHTLGIIAPVAAAALGAVVIEKHLTLSRKMPGVDHLASAEPDEFKNMVQGVRQVEKMLGSPRKSPQPCEKKNIPIVRKRLVARAEIRKHDKFSEQNVAAKRSTKGLDPIKFWDLLGTRAKRSFCRDEAIA